MKRPTGPVNDCQSCCLFLIAKAVQLGQRSRMRHLLSTLLLVFVIGCVPVTTYYAEGVSIAEMDRDTRRCEIHALREAPVQLRTQQDPPEYIKREACDGYGNCHEYGYWVPGRTYTVDLNEGLRELVQDQCMKGRGYRAVSIPSCSRDVVQNAPAKSTTIMPRLGPKSCAIRQNNGRFLIVN